MNVLVCVCSADRCTCRMEHYLEQRMLSIYGYSSAFGQAPHDVSAAVARKWLPLHDISVSYKGY